ncbi:MAG: copper amine oxidase N-terminal domain-containing protein, partial [Syntrophomonadaceae bacterium]
MGKRYLLRMFAIMLVAIVMIGPVYGARAAESGAESTFAGIDYQKSDDIRVIIDGKQLVFDVNPQVVDNRTLVPMRTIFEAFGLTVTWDESTNTVTGKSDETVIILTIGSNKATVNGQERILDVPASVITGRTMIPLRFLSESMQYKVVWIGASNLILISKTDIIEWRYTGFEATAPYREYETKWINGVQTAQTRYTGKNHPVEIVTLYNADGRIITGLPDFSVPTYGAGWYLQSPLKGKTYWVDIDAILTGSNNRGFVAPGTFVAINSQIFRDSAPTGNYLKVMVEDHYFDLDTWKQLNFDPGSPLAAVTDASQLAGKEISSADTFLKVFINDQYRGLITVNHLLGTL